MRTSVVVYVGIIKRPVLDAGDAHVKCRTPTRNRLWNLSLGICGATPCPLRTVGYFILGRAV